MKIYDIAIIGAGPAGLIAAITAASSGKTVIILEKNTIIGRKILATGNGRCNLTNRDIKVERYHGANPDFIQTILFQFNQLKTMQYFESLGLILKEEDNGRIFPRTNQASSVVEALSHELLRLNVTVNTDCLVTEINYKTNWHIKINNNSVIDAKKLIITTGGTAAPQLGSSGDGFTWAQKLGHKLTPIYPALVPLETIETWPKSVSGIKIEANAKVVVDKKILSQKTGDLLFTHYGLSGPAIMDQARIVASLIKKNKVKIQIDTIPEETAESLNNKIEKIFNANGTKSVKNALAGAVPIKLIAAILNNLAIDYDKKAARISRIERLAIVKNLKNLVLTISKPRSLKEAQVTAGGIIVAEIDAKTLESKIVPNLFFAGEIIDVDGDSGGFNLQWAWSSGYVAGKSASS
jgi:hypothetical protein